MNVRAQLRQLQKEARNVPPPDQITLITAAPADGETAHGRPPGVYFNADGRVATVVFAGDKPDEKVLARLQARMPKWGLTIICNPATITPPTDHPSQESPPATFGRRDTVGKLHRL